MSSVLWLEASFLRIVLPWLIGSRVDLVVSGVRGQSKCGGTCVSVSTHLGYYSSFILFLIITENKIELLAILLKQMSQ
jgi:hypothetical protein